jgi:hypothetical protein
MQHRVEPPSGPLLNDHRALKRAALALRCLPFRRAFYEEVSDRALSSSGLCSRNDASSLCRRNLTPDRAEADWIWVRLTPMGRELLAKWPGEIPTPSGFDRLLHALRRWRPRL